MGVMMTFFGVIARREQEELLIIKTDEFNRQIEALKASLPDYADWLLQTAEAEKYNFPDLSAMTAQADMFRLSDFLMQADDITAPAGALTGFEVKRLVPNTEPKHIPNPSF